MQDSSAGYACRIAKAVKYKDHSDLHYIYVNGKLSVHVY